MRPFRRILCLGGLLGAVLNATAAGQSTNSSSELDLGVEAYKNARYEEAIHHFRKAVASDPSNVSANLHLATVYAQEYIPGVDTPDNIQVGQDAIAQYKRVLELDSSNINATKGIAFVNFNMKNFDVAKEYHRKAAEIDPKDAETYYSMGVIDWTQTYQPRMETRAKLGLRPDQSMIATPECWAVRNANQELVADGIEMLKKAIDLRRDYDDAMAYMNLMYRERADIQCGDPKAHASDVKIADQWVDMTLAIKKRKAESENRKGASAVFSTAPNPQ